MKEKDSVFNNARSITGIIICLILIIILLSQSWAISNNLSPIIIFRSILNHNSLYFLLLIYFIGIKLEIGKKYFNHLNLFLILLYLINTITSFLTLIQFFVLNSLLEFLINFVVYIYLVHTTLRGTRVWRDYKLNNSPFNEITNEWYYDFLLIVPTILLIVNLMSSTSLNGVAISIMDYFYILLFARYIYLYREFLDRKSINSNNQGDFDVIKEKVVDAANDIKDKIDDFIEDNNIDDKLDAAKDKIVDIKNNMKDKVDDFIEDNNIDDKLDVAKDKIVDITNNMKDKVDDFIEDKEQAPSNKSKKRKKKNKIDKKGSE